MKVCEGVLRKKVDNKDLLICGAIVDNRSSSIIELYKELAYDMLFIDREHSALNSETICDHIRVARALELPCMVRVAEDCYHEFNRTLDQAPDGVYIPRIRTRKQVEKIVRTVKYQPYGIRGLAGSTCPIGKYKGWNSLPEQIQTVNKNMVIGIQIETAEALKNLDEILSVEGVDIAVIGNDDLSMSMGIPGQIESKKYIETVEKIIDTCQKYDVLPGIPTGDSEMALYWIKKGMKVIWYSCDIYAIWLGLNQQMSSLKNGLAKLKK